MDSANCAGADPDLFFPTKGGDTASRTAEAKAVCDACPVQIPCLDYALVNHERWGIWGGTTEPKRRRLRRARLRHGDLL